MERKKENKNQRVLCYKKTQKYKNWNPCKWLSITKAKTEAHLKLIFQKVLKIKKNIHIHTIVKSLFISAIYKKKF